MNDKWIKYQEATQAANREGSCGRRTAVIGLIHGKVSQGNGAAPFYSHLSATIGSTRIARRAGMKLARRPQRTEITEHQ